MAFQLAGYISKPGVFLGHHEIEAIDLEQGFQLASTRDLWADSDDIPFQPLIRKWEGENDLL